MRGLGSRLLTGGRYLTFYNTLVPDGFNEGGYQSVPVYYNTAVHYNTTYSHNTGQNVWVVFNTSHLTSSYYVIGGEFGGFWMTFATEYQTGRTSYQEWTTSYPVDTWYAQQTHYYSDQYYEHWTDTSYYRQTWRETSY